MERHVLVQVRGLAPTASGSAVFLGHEEKAIALFIDQHVASAIALFLQDIKKPRPRRELVHFFNIKGHGAKLVG